MPPKTDEYTADARCLNCGYEGPVTRPVGVSVYRGPCPVCQTTHLKARALLDDERERQQNPFDPFE